MSGKGRRFPCESCCTSCNSKSCCSRSLTSLLTITARHWEELQTGVPCPIRFSSEEIDAHNRVSADWNKKADFWTSLEGFVGRDGYTANEDYERGRTFFQELLEEGLPHLSRSEQEEFAELVPWAKK